MKLTPHYYTVRTTLLLIVLHVTTGNSQTWTEDTFAEFSDGRLDASGQNLYVSRDGRIRTIHRFDLNQDGNLDLIFNSTHDTYAYIPATLCTAGPDRQLKTAPLAVQGSNRVQVADLNRDGYVDVVFCPNRSGIQHSRRFVTILWGGADGWSAERSNGQLPVHTASRRAVADLNHDDWPDIVVLNGPAWLPNQPQGNIVRIFWGSQDGFLFSQRRDLGISSGKDLAAADIDQDGAADLAVLVGNGRLKLFWATPIGESQTPLEAVELVLPGDTARCVAVGDCDQDGNLDFVLGTDEEQLYMITGKPDRQFDPVVTVPAMSASRVTIGDLDGDKQPDLVLTKLDLGYARGGELAGGPKQPDDAVDVLWGDRGRFEPARSLRLSVPHAAATAIGDLDNDGQNDLAVAVHQGHDKFATDSQIFFGLGQRRFVRSKHPLGTEGAGDVAIVPASDHHPARAIFCNRLGGTVHEAVPLQVYWGNSSGFDPTNYWEIPFDSGYEASAADLNADGYVDLVALNSGHGGEVIRASPLLGANIFWGSENGFDLENRRTVVREYELGSSNVADLDRDGYLDLVLGAYGPEKDNQPSVLVVRYGSAKGFELSRRLALPCDDRSIGCVIADFNRDNWLDLAATSMAANRVHIFWGGPEGFDSQHRTRLRAMTPDDIESADLNSDGYLDLIVACYNDPITGLFDTGLLVLWGGRDGFRHWNAQWLPGFAPVGMAVADFDSDGHLDLFSPNYHGNQTRESLPSFLFWGGPNGIHPRRRTNLICNSAHDALAGDFNRDGLIDLAVSCHSEDGSHHTHSKVFYNDGQRFTAPQIQSLPTHGTHSMYLQDMGHIYNRKWQQTYQSSVFSWDQPETGGRLTMVAKTPGATILKLAVRSATNMDQLVLQPWRDVVEDKFKLEAMDRHLQYQATFISDNGDRYPVLDKVTLKLSP